MFEIMECPICRGKAGYVKAGTNDSGSQRYQCRECLTDDYTGTQIARILQVE